MNMDKIKIFSILFFNFSVFGFEDYQFLSKSDRFFSSKITEHNCPECKLFNDKEKKENSNYLPLDLKKELELGNCARKNIKDNFHLRCYFFQQFLEAIGI